MKNISLSGSSSQHSDLDDRIHELSGQNMKDKFPLKMWHTRLQNYDAMREKRLVRETRGIFVNRKDLEIDVIES